MSHLLSRLAVRAIVFYRRHLSPLKGYRCAYGTLTGVNTCSSQGLRIFRRAGFWAGLRLLRRQFDACTLSAARLQELRSIRAEATGTHGDAGTADAQSGRYRRLVRMSYGHQSQAGFIDCDCPVDALPDDCTSCDDKGSNSCDSKKACRTPLRWLDCFDSCQCIDCSDPRNNKGKDGAREIRKLQQRLKEVRQREMAQQMAREERRFQRKQ